MIKSRFLKKGIIVFASCFFLASSAAAANYVSITKDNVNIRTGPSTSNPVYMELFKGYPLKVASKKGEWFKVTDFEGDSGWVHSSLTKSGNTVIVNAKKSVNMRSSASTKASIIANVERGVVLTKLSREGNWTKVRHGGGTVGWIYNQLLWP